MTKNNDTEKSSKVTLLWIVLLFGSAALLFALGVVLYAIRVSASARKLIDSASAIRSTADADRQVAMWRNRSGRDFWESTSPKMEITAMTFMSTMDCYIAFEWLRQQRSA